MKGLIVTADDFGLAPEVNEAVETAHRNGILTTASLMVGAAAADDAVARAKRLPALRVGLHLVLVEGRPVSPPASIPALTDGHGQFHDDMMRTALAIFFAPAARGQLATEIAAQFERFAATGLPLDHVTAHKHFYLHPTVADLVLKIGRRFGLRAARAPLEPRDILAAIDQGERVAPAIVTGFWARRMQRRFRRAGLHIPDRCFGLCWSGAMTEARLRGLLNHLPDGLSEIYLHPATADGFEGAAPGYRYRQELAAITAPAVIDAVRETGARLGGFADFAAPVSI